MSGTTIGTFSVVVVLGVDLLLIIGLVGLKAVHRGRRERHDQRRALYIVGLSRHLAFRDANPLHLDDIDDEAFLDAVIDLRNVVTGVDASALAGILDRTGLAKRQEARLRRRFPLGGRLRASVALAEMGDESTAPVLLEFLDDPEPEIRIQCARGLGRMQHVEAIERILARFATEEAWVRARFADTLVGYGRKASSHLVRYVLGDLAESENQGVIEAIRVLGTIGDQEVGPALAAVLRVTVDPEVSLATIEALGQVGGPLAIRPVKYAFRSPDWRLRAKSATSLGLIGDPSANPALATGLEDSNWWVRRNCAAALAAIPGGSDHLFGALLSEDPFARDAAAEALADAGALTAAREREDAGAATEQDRLLLDHMADGSVVAR
jgi:HEAT repeat protein